MELHILLKMLRFVCLLLAFVLKNLAQWIYLTKLDLY